jgi:hypothetical protein
MGYIPRAILFLQVSLQRRVTKSVRLIAAVALLCGPLLTLTALAVSPDEPNQARAQRDGQHDFDFNTGVWHTHIRRVLDPFAGSTQSMELNGTVFVRKVWNGSAQLEEIEADGPKGHWEGLTLFLYNPQSHQWSQSFIDSKMGELSAPLIGAFKDGRGELFSQDTFHGKTVLVRGVWSHIEPDSHHYEESYSADGGKTWAAAFIADLTRDSRAEGNRSSAEVRAKESGMGGRIWPSIRQMVRRVTLNC